MYQSIKKQVNNDKSIEKTAMEKQGYISISPFFERKYGYIGKVL
jgi:hypothetical protein